MDFELIPNYLGTEIDHEGSEYCHDEYEALCEKIYNDYIVPSRTLSEEPCKRHQYHRVDIAQSIDHDPLFSNKFEAIAVQCVKCGRILSITLNGVYCCTRVNDGCHAFPSFVHKDVKINHDKLYHPCLISYSSIFDGDDTKIDYKNGLINVILSKSLFCKSCKSAFGCPKNYMFNVYSIDIHNVDEKDRNQVEEEIRSLIRQLIDCQTTPIEGMLNFFCKGHKENNTSINYYNFIFAMIDKMLIGKELLHGTKIIVRAQNPDNHDINAEVIDFGFGQHLKEN